MNSSDRLYVLPIFGLSKFHYVISTLFLYYIWVLYCTEISTRAFSLRIWCVVSIYTTNQKVLFCPWHKNWKFRSLTSNSIKCKNLERRRVWVCAHACVNFKMSLGYRSDVLLRIEGSCRRVASCLHKMWVSTSSRFSTYVLFCLIYIRVSFGNRLFFVVCEDLNVTCYRSVVTPSFHKRDSSDRVMTV
jgi:hypothetical protein